MIYSNQNYTNNYYLPVWLDCFTLFCLLIGSTSSLLAALHVESYNFLTLLFLLGLFCFRPVAAFFVGVLVFDVEFVTSLGLFLF